jgi:hypothetical protein
MRILLFVENFDLRWTRWTLIIGCLMYGDQWNENWHGSRKYSRKSAPVSLSVVTTNNRLWYLVAQIRLLCTSHGFRHVAREVLHDMLCVYALYPLLTHFTLPRKLATLYEHMCPSTFHGIWYGIYVIGICCNFDIVNLPRPVIITWRSQELVGWEWYWRHIL